MAGRKMIVSFTVFKNNAQRDRLARGWIAGCRVNKMTGYLHHARQKLNCPPSIASCWALNCLMIGPQLPRDMPSRNIAEPFH